MLDETVGHVPVLLGEVVELLSPGAGEVVLDCTLGRGGHAAAIIPLIPGGVYLGMDVDGQNVGFAEARLRPIAAAHGVRLIVVQANFAAARSAVTAAGLLGEAGNASEKASDGTSGGGGGVDCLLADLGFASNQMDDPGRGFSFMGDGPLDMRLGRAADRSKNDDGEGAEEGAEQWLSLGFESGDGGVTAGQLVNTLPEQELANLIYRYGEERLSRRIARKIIERRAESPIKKTGELAELCRRAYGPAASKSRIHPATRTFQALRIAVNGELEALDGLLDGLIGLLNPGGRAGIISFHSLEDRPIKQAFLKMQQDGLAKRLTRKPITAGLEEIAHNPRSRSAKLRGVKRV